MRLKNILLTIAVTLVLFVAYFFIVLWKLPDWAQRGQFGDMFGTLNSFFTALAFIGVFYTLLQQNEIIKQNSKQLTNSKLEFETQLKIQALTTLINIYQIKFDELKNINLMEANQVKKKIYTLTEELESFLLKK